MDVTEESKNDEIAKELEYWRDNHIACKEYFRLEDAHQAARMTRLGGFSPVFGREIEGKDGAMKYVVTSYEVLWQQMVSKTYKELHYYETILPNIPCHLHVDAEYYLSSNPDINHEWVHKMFVEETKKVMVEKGYASKMEDIRIKHGVSSNDKKISRHYLFILKKKAFKNNYHCGAFIRRLRNHFIQKFGPVEENPFFFCPDPQGKQSLKDPDFLNDTTNKVFYADLGIYTHRRQFRILYNTKESNTERPLLSEEQHKLTNNYHIKVSDLGDKIVMNKREYLEFIIQRTSWDDELVTCMEIDGSEPISTSHKKKFRDDVVISNSINNNNNNNEDGSLQEEEGTWATVIPCSVARIQRGDDTQSDSVITSGFPSFVMELAEMMRDQVQNGAYVKPIQYYPLSGLVVVTTSSRVCQLKSAACGRKNASHSEGGKSGNCVYFVIDTPKREWYQRCHSIKPPCNGKRTQSIRIKDKYVELLNRVDAERAKLVRSDQSARGFIKIFSDIRAV